jgi:tripartite-type tricarboxylate transporter receptor subunit TctC
MLPSRRQFSFRTRLITLIAALGFSASASAAYPDRPIRIIDGFPPGGATDVVARILAKEIGEALGQSVVVENRPGAGSNIATQHVASSKPDGYTLYMMAVTSAINQTLYKNIKFNIVEDFQPVAQAVKLPNLLVVNPGLPVASVQELVDYAKANPGKLNFASAGSGTSTHMSGEMFKLLAKIDVMHVPYKGSAPASQDLIGGQVDFMFDNMPSAWPNVESGRLRALAVTTAERSETAPNIPTVKEAGYPTFDVASWWGLVAPKGTPPEIVNKLNEVVQVALAKEDVIERLKGLGATPVQSTPQQFGALIKSEVESWAKVVKASGASVD